MHKLRWLVLALLTIAALAAAGCGGDDDSGGGDGGGDAGGEPIKVGASLPLTGEFSEPGKAAQQGYKVWEAMVNDSGGLIDGRPVKMVIKDDQSNQNTIVADYNALISQDKVDLLLGTFSSLLNLPASAVAERNRMLYVEPAGGAPELFERGFKMLFFAQQATADKQGEVWANWVTQLARGPAPEDCRLPDARRPVRAADLRGDRGDLQQGRDQDRLPRDLHDRQPELRRHRQRDQVARTRTSSSTARPSRTASEWCARSGSPASRRRCSTRRRPRRWATSTPRRSASRTTEGIFYAVSHSKEATTPGNEEFVAKYQEMFGGTEVPEDAADAYATAQVLQAAVKAVGTIDRERQLELADWLRENEVDTILGPLTWDDLGRPEGEFLVGQWQNGVPEIVLPEEAATSDKIIPEWRPDGGG